MPTEKAVAPPTLQQQIDYPNSRGAVYTISSLFAVPFTVLTVAAYFGYLPLMSFLGCAAFVLGGAMFVLITGLLYFSKRHRMFAHGVPTEAIVRAIKITPRSEIRSIEAEYTHAGQVHRTWSNVHPAIADELREQSRIEIRVHPMDAREWLLVDPDGGARYRV